VASSVWQDLGVCYEIVARVESDYRPRVALDVQRFTERAAPDDPALPAARKYLEMRRARAVPMTEFSRQVHSLLHMLTFLSVKQKT
jgi:hypothetical protein